MTGNDRTAFQNGLNAWNNSPAPVIFVSGSATNQVEMRDENDGNSGYDGYTNYNTSSRCNHSGYSIVVYAWAVLNTYFTNGYSGPETQSVAAHELGHTIGLGDVTTNTNGTRQLMYYYTPTRWGQWGINTPQTDDVNGIKAIYSISCN